MPRRWRRQPIAALALAPKTPGPEVVMIKEKEVAAVLKHNAGSGPGYQMLWPRRPPRLEVQYGQPARTNQQSSHLCYETGGLCRREGSLRIALGSEQVLRAYHDLSPRRQHSELGVHLDVAKIWDFIQRPRMRVHFVERSIALLDLQQLFVFVEPFVRSLV